MSSVMQLSNKLYQKSVVERIAGTDWQDGNDAPFVVELDPTAACDLACPGCISEDLIALGNRFSNERLLELGQEMVDCGVKAVILIGGGEPLAHPKAGELIELFGRFGVHVGITTNGSFIDRYLPVIAEHAQWTRVSMDAATEQLFGKLRPTKAGPRNKFQKIVSNMWALAKVKKGKLGYSFLIQTEADGPGVACNINEIYDAALLAREIGCDYFEVKPSYQFRGGVAHALMRHDAGRMREAAEEVKRLDALETDRFKIMYAINLQDSLEGVARGQPKDYKVCPSTHLRTTVTPTGVFVCPYWRGKEPMRVGDATKQSFRDLWKGALRQEVMGRLDASRDCNFHCLRHKTNVAARTIKQQLVGGVNVVAVDEFDRFI